MFRQCIWGHHWFVLVLFGLLEHCVFVLFLSDHHVPFYPRLSCHGLSAAFGEGNEVSASILFSSYFVDLHHVRRTHGKTGSADSSTRNSLYKLDTPQSAALFRAGQSLEKLRQSTIYLMEIRLHDPCCRILVRFDGDAVTLVSAAVECLMVGILCDSMTRQIILFEKWPMGRRTVVEVELKLPS